MNKKNRNAKRFGTLFLSLMFLFSMFLQTTPASSFGSFSVHALIPENQVDKSKTYFDLRLDKNQEQTIQIEIVNSANVPMDANIALNPASTGQNGLIIYSENDARDTSVVYSITDVAKVSTPQVTIPAQSTKMIDIEINMPDTAFDGVILGGIIVTNGSIDKKSKQADGNVQIANEVAYTLGLKLTQNDKVIEPELNLQTIEPGLVNYATAIIVNLQNSQPIIMKNMSIEGAVYKKNGTEALAQLALDNAEMAPNSNGNFILDWKGKAIKPGEYRLVMTAKYLDKVWQWDEPFSVSGSESSGINDEALNIENNYMVILYILLAILLVIIVGYGAYKIGQTSSRKKNN